MEKTVKIRVGFRKKKNQIAVSCSESLFGAKEIS
jgi:hypothetical protein